MDPLLKLSLLQKAFSLGSQLAPAWTGDQVLKFFCRTTRFKRSVREENDLQHARIFRTASGLRAYEWQTAASPKGQVLLVHGWNGRATQLGAVARELSTQGYRCVAMDVYGHGDSPGHESDVKMFQSAISQAQEEWGEFHAIIGHSMGAAASVWAVHAGVAPKKLVLVGSPSSFQRVIDLFMLRMKLNSRLRTEFEMRIKKRVSLGEDYLEVARMGVELQVSTLLVHDENDIEVPIENADRMKAVWEKLDVFKTRGQGHRRILRSPAVLHKISDFLAA